MSYFTVQLTPTTTQDQMCQQKEEGAGAGWFIIQARPELFFNYKITSDATASPIWRGVGALE